MADLQTIAGVDRLIHEPARLMIMSVLYAVDTADFFYLLCETGLTKGNLSSHLGKLEGGGYVEIEKTFRNKVSHTVCRCTPPGRDAFRCYRDRLKRVVSEMPR